MAEHIRAEDDPTSPAATPDAAVLLSLPGIGTRVLAALLAERSDAVRRRAYHALRCLCGVAPVTFGKGLVVERRLAAHGRLRDAVLPLGLVSPSSSIRSATAGTGRCVPVAAGTAAPCARLPIAC